MRRRRGIDVIPDVLCNAGGVVVSCFDGLQNKRSDFWELDEVNDKLRRRMFGAYDRVRYKANELNIAWHTAAHIIALTRLERIDKERGLFP